MALLWYVLLIWLAICGAIAIACFYAALWLIAIVAAVVMIGIRAVRGQRGDQPFRKPFTPKLPSGIKRPIPQARFSNRR